METSDNTILLEVMDAALSVPKKEELNFTDYAGARVKNNERR